jgi:hypothetical protein
MDGWMRKEWEGDGDFMYCTIVVCDFYIDDFTVWFALVVEDVCCGMWRHSLVLHTR